MGNMVRRSIIRVNGRTVSQRKIVKPTNKREMKPTNQNIENVPSGNISKIQPVGKPLIGKQAKTKREYYLAPLNTPEKVSGPFTSFSAAIQTIEENEPFLLSHTKEIQINTEFIKAFDIFSERYSIDYCKAILFGCVCDVSDPADGFLALRELDEEGPTSLIFPNAFSTIKTEDETITGWGQRLLKYEAALFIEGPHEK